MILRIFLSVAMLHLAALAQDSQPVASQPAKPKEDKPTRTLPPFVLWAGEGFGSYHADGCENYKPTKSARSMRRSEAEDNKLRPCPKCRPDTLAETPATAKQIAAEQLRAKKQWDKDHPPPPKQAPLPPLPESEGPIMEMLVKAHRAGRVDLFEPIVSSEEKYRTGTIVRFDLAGGRMTVKYVSFDKKTIIAEAFYQYIDANRVYQWKGPRTIALQGFGLVDPFTDQDISREMNESVALIAGTFNEFGETILVATKITRLAHAHARERLGDMSQPKSP